MSSKHRNDRKERRNEELERRRRSNMRFGLATTVLVVMIAAAVSISRGSGPGDSPDASVSEPSRTGTATVLGVTSDAQEVALGHVGLNKTVTPTWKLTNESTETVLLGKAHAEVIEGCCPGPLEFDKTRLAPGESAELTFPLQMHPGMDGPHDFDVHVPITRGSSEEIMTLSTTGHFSA
jgi:hypothetical protein